MVAHGRGYKLWCGALQGGFQCCRLEACTRQVADHWQAMSAAVAQSDMLPRQAVLHLCMLSSLQKERSCGHASTHDNVLLHHLLLADVSDVSAQLTVGPPTLPKHFAPVTRGRAMSSCAPRRTFRDMVECAFSATRKSGGICHLGKWAVPEIVRQTGRDFSRVETDTGSWC